MADTSKTPERVPSRQEVYLQRLADDHARQSGALPAEEVNSAPYAVEDQDTSAFVGVSPEYKTYSGVFKQPLVAEEGPTAEAEAEAEERQQRLQQENEATREAKAGGAAAAVTPEDEEATSTKNTDEENANTDAPQLPPVPTSSRRRGTHAKSDDDTSDDEN